MPSIAAAFFMRRYTPPMRCRPASPADIRLLAEMNARLIRDEGHRNPMDVEQLHDRMARWLAGDYAATLFEHDGRTIGYALYRPDGPTLHIRHLYIEPAHRRRGHGTAAVKWLIDLAWPDCTRLRIEVLCHNEAALQFYRSLGFEDYCLVMERPV